MESDRQDRTRLDAPAEGPDPAGASARAAAPEPAVASAPADPLPSAAAAAEVALRGWADRPGRSVAARLVRAGHRWEMGVRANDPLPAASLLKLPIALAVDDALAHGRIDPALRRTTRELLAGAPVPSLLHALDPELGFGIGDLLALCLGMSDGPAATALLALVGIDAVRAAIAAAGCTATEADALPADDPAGPLAGHTTAWDAIRLLDAAADPVGHPRTALALRHSIRNSRIPLGATDRDVAIAHKTGSLPGLAHDVARIEAAGGVLHIAFLATEAHDTLAAGYEMGIATRALLDAWGLGTLRTRSVG